eukprot:scaffold139256_cov105-Phaeocystis_antarctica.AAC.1
MEARFGGRPMTSTCTSCPDRVRKSTLTRPRSKFGARCFTSYKSKTRALAPSQRFDRATSGGDRSKARRLAQNVPSCPARKTY